MPGGAICVLGCEANGDLLECRFQNAECKMISSCAAYAAPVNKIT